MALIVVARFVAYLASIVSSVLLAGRLLSSKSNLARLLAALMGAWLLNSLILLSYLLWRTFTGETSAPWQEVTTTLNAVLLALCPAVLYVYLGRVDGKG